MINKAIQRTQKPLILALSIAGAVIGLSLLMLVTQVYTNLNTLKEEGFPGAINEQYLVLNKEMNAGNTLGIFSSTLSESDLEELATQKFVKDLAPFTTGRDFQVFAEVNLEGGTGGNSLAFIESVPDKFIDVDPEDWFWDLDAEYIPVIMPTSFLDMYNFGLAESMNSPKISKDMAGLLAIKMTIKGNGLTHVYYGRIKAFSDRINSALVPMSFITYANETYGSGGEQEPSKVIIATNNNKDPAIAKYLEDHGLVTNKEQLRGSMIEKMIQPLLWFTGSLCVIIIVMTILIFLLYGEVLIVKSKYDIHVLSLLGFRWKEISKVFNQYFLKIYGVIAIISGVIFVGTNLWVNTIIMDNLMTDHLALISWQTLLAMTLFIGLFISINIFNTRKHIKQIARGR